MNDFRLPSVRKQDATVVVSARWGIPSVRSVLPLLLVTLLQGITSADPLATTVHPVSFRSEGHGVQFATNFPGGKFDTIEEMKPNEFEIVIRPELTRPELEPINDSAWYAFAVKSDRKREIEVSLRYEGGSHRYEPKISRDRREWESAEHLVVSRHPSGRRVTMRLPVDGQPLWVAGQELICDDEVDDWMDSLSEKPFVKRAVIGKSVQQRPLHRIVIGAEHATESIFILSRQHPPEVTGTIGMMHFVDALSADTEIAREFRDHFKIVVVPVANPDGVAKGFWRSNANGVDLNRDWLRFTQPETKAIRNELTQLKTSDEGRLWLFLDFHSTFNEVLYTSPTETKLFPDGFTTEWVSAMNDRVPNFNMLHDDEHNEHRSTSKAWVSRELGIHAITYEFGDETERERIRDIAIGSAEEMMRLLLERHRKQ